MSENEKIIITREGAIVHGMSPIFDEEKEDGRLLFYRMHQDGSGYIRIESPKGPTRQKAHFHEFTTELYVVQEGLVQYAYIDNNTLEVVIPEFEKDIVFLVPPNTHHSIIMRPGSVMHVVKFGSAKNYVSDWHSSPRLESILKVLL